MQTECVTYGMSTKTYRIQCGHVLNKDFLAMFQERITDQLTNLGKEMRSVHSFQHLWRSPSDAQSTAEIREIVSKLLEI